MQTNQVSRSLRISCLLLATSLMIPVSQAAFTFTDPDGLWFHADDPATLNKDATTGVVSNWTDDSTGGPNVSLAAGGTAPVWSANVQNGQPAVTFSGSGNLSASSVVASSFLTAGNQSSTYLVLRPTSSAAATFLGWLDASQGVNNLVQSSQTSTLNYVEGNNNSGGKVTGTFPGDWLNNWHVVSMIRNGSSGIIRVDGVQVGSGTFTSSLNTSGTGTLALGGSFPPGDYFTGDIAEVLLYRSGTTDVSGTELFLGAKYGIAAVPEPSQYAIVFSVVCIAGALVIRSRRQRTAAV
jgi:hypothetical protein